MRVGIVTMKARFGVLVRMRSPCGRFRKSATWSNCWQACTKAGDCMKISSMVVSCVGNDNAQRPGLHAESHRRIAGIFAVDFERRGAVAAEFLRLKIMHTGQPRMRAAQNSLAIAEQID